MEKFTTLFLSALFFAGTVFSQEDGKTADFEPSGKAFAKVFFNYNYNLSDGAEQRNTFALQRAYIGYKYDFSSDISFKLTLDAVRSVKDVEGNVLSPYTANLKHAQIDWKVASPLKLSIGLIGLKQFDTQEKFWGYRYIYKSFQDEFELGSSADLGFNAEVKIIDNLKANLFVLNGEGYSRVQDNMGRLKVGGNLLFEPVDGLIIKAYYDVYGGKIQNDSGLIIKDTASINTIAFFAGYKTDKFRFGAEYNLQLNGKKYYQIAENHDLSGLSLYGTYVINKQFEVFANYLAFKSNTLNGATDPWNYKKDGSGIIAGLQFIPVKGVKAALNYRTYIYDNPDNTTASLIYVNFEYSF